MSDDELKNLFRDMFFRAVELGMGKLEYTSDGGNQPFCRLTLDADISIEDLFFENDNQVSLTLNQFLSNQLCVFVKKADFCVCSIMVDNIKEFVIHGYGDEYGETDELIYDGIKKEFYSVHHE